MASDALAKPKKFIDVEQVIASKSPRLLKFLPGFIIRYLKKIIHEDELNWGLNEFGHKQGVEFIDEVLKYFQVSYTVEGLDNLNVDERYIFASNHPLGGLDGMILIHSISNKFSDVKVPSNDLLMNIKQLQDNFIPVNKHGSQTRENARIMDETYASDTQMFIFPAGLCSRKQGGKIEDLEWKKSFIAKATKHKRPVVPVFFSGRNSNFFYNLSRIRTFLGIKVNLEMLYLVDEMFKQRGQKPHIVIGEPIPYETFDGSRTPQEWAKWVKARVYELSK
ncbi:MAG: 1-acyl-sn-glycerol-3-phosphate acyltransferase [Tenuifilaceae bacterium]|jgi:1-acyl-sn-glycerol-3-phosphate acyltransferase|uniref:1-acyl-sn-glycerol-3-phosphate acyltransferase n=1 Tax=Perlabentimonas gracilis TaxID=2715279 RepID=UPI001409F1AD|nr:1-acyl-sn-glycerol-3-phosphate acyltransferase [Perlabentimonas gracilis]MDX9770736.1 1-acyl-sn-glycerol-3-phosphate acyltransferase [Tenuifilaceae bacterium]NHB69980.1 glycerol acyltransferase [Perlabentimonas gracilis]